MQIGIFYRHLKQKLAFSMSWLLKTIQSDYRQRGCMLGGKQRLCALPTMARLLRLKVSPTDHGHRLGWLFWLNKAQAANPRAIVPKPYSAIIGLCMMECEMIHRFPAINSSGVIG